MSTIRLESIDSFALQSTRLTGSRLARYLVKRRLKCYQREGRKCGRFDSNRLESIDSFALQSTRLTGSRFARHLVKRRLKCYE